MADLSQRRKALEDSFYAPETGLESPGLKSTVRADTPRERLAAASGIRNEALLDSLLKLDISASTWVSLSLVPLVEVAWADGSIAERERRAILSAAESNGVALGSTSHALLEMWLRQRPTASLDEAWRGYVTELCSQLDRDSRLSLRDELLSRARKVAEAAGGLLGVGRVSDSEKGVLARLAAAFE
jgi:hypothetical protein